MLRLSSAASSPARLGQNRLVQRQGAVVLVADEQGMRAARQRRRQHRRLALGAGIRQDIKSVLLRLDAFNEDLDMSTAGQPDLPGHRITYLELDQPGDIPGEHRQRFAYHRTLDASAGNGPGEVAGFIDTKLTPDRTRGRAPGRYYGCHGDIMAALLPGNSLLENIITHHSATPLFPPFSVKAPS